MAPHFSYLIWTKNLLFVHLIYSDLLPSQAD